MMWFACPSCSRPLQAEEGQIGRTGTCPGCGTTCRVPAGERPTAADTASPSPTVAYDPPAAAPVEVPGYEVLGELGRGGMGVIYKTRQFHPPRLVALKMILAGEHAGAEALASLRSEAGAFARLVHPNIVQIHEIGEHNGRPYLTLRPGRPRKPRAVPADIRASSPAGPCRPRCGRPRTTRPSAR